MFLLAGVLQRLQHYDDGVSKYMTPPSLPENFKDLKAAKRGYAKYLYRCCLVHYHQQHSRMQRAPLLCLQ